MEDNILSGKLIATALTFDDVLIARGLKADQDESLEGIRKGLADAAAGHMQPVAEVFEELRRELKQ